jgi:hypothetical protein
MSANLSELYSTIRRLKDDVALLSRIAESVEQERVAAGTAESPGVELPSEVRVPRPSAVAAYLQADPDLVPIVSGMATALVYEFRNERHEIELTLYEDPEIDDPHLVFYVRLPSYGESLMPRLDAVSEPFDEPLRTTSDRVLITTDYEPIS